MIYILFFAKLYLLKQEHYVDEHTAAWAHNKDGNIKEEDSVLLYIFLLFRNVKTIAWKQKCN